MPTLAVPGAELYFETHGEGQPLLLMHGTGAYADMWTPVLPGLAASYRVITYDRRGFGRSTASSRVRLSDHTRDAAVLLEHLEASPAVVVGWSGGGLVALDLAAAEPQRVAQLVLAEPAVRMLTHPTIGSLAMGLRSAAQRHLRRDPAAAARTMYRFVSGRSTGGNSFDELPPAWQDQMSRNGSTTVREMDQLLLLHPRRAAIRSISCPVTLIDGDLSEPAFAKCLGYLRKLQPEARSVRLTGAGHFLHIDQPQQWVDALVSTADAG
jgi:pimeloyl-ACP methyl ester carboxylesterase